MRTILLFVYSLLLSISFATLASAQERGKETVIVHHKNLGAPMPSFEIKTNEAKINTDRDFEAFDNLVLILFNPTCDHCINLGKEIAANPKVFKNTAVVYIAANGMDDYLKYFIDQTGLDKVLGKNIVMGVDQTPNAGLGNSFSVFLAQLFEYQLPQVNIYNKERKMIFKRSGAIALDEILKAM